MKIAVMPCQRPRTDDVRAAVVASSTLVFPQERWQLLHEEKGRLLFAPLELDGCSS